MCSRLTTPNALNLDAKITYCVSHSIVFPLTCLEPEIILGMGTAFDCLALKAAGIQVNKYMPWTMKGTLIT